jgi:hypothetical protein
MPSYRYLSYYFVFIPNFGYFFPLDPDLILRLVFGSRRRLNTDLMPIWIRNIASKTIVFFFSDSNSSKLIVTT